MDKRLLHILRCPITYKGLSVARRDTLSRVNAAIESGKLTNREGTVVDEPLDEALITDDGKRVYPVIDGMPAMFESSCIDLDQLE